MHVGVDIGGTFTDLVRYQDGQLHIHKLLSTPDDPARAMLAGLEAVTPGGLAALQQVSHGSTVATNAILERKGARTALLTTEGFRDLLFIGRQNRPDLYALQPTLPPPLIPRGWCYEVPERLDPTGAVLTPLDMTALDRVLDAMQTEQIESVAVCFLYSYRNPAHEQAVQARMIERGLFREGQIALSSEVLPEFREYERASTVALDAYVRPVMSRYLSRLETSLQTSPVHPHSGQGAAVAGLRIMKSDGGVISAARAREQAVQTALSGPAAGVIGAWHLARLAGFDRLLTMDIGGTSTDVALCPGAPLYRPESEIDGLPLRIRLLDIETIGAGGGSIARLDAGGALRVGPESAGAMPGPICYGRGGTQVTVSDANAVLGRLDAGHFLGGAMRLDAESARAAVTRLADQLGLPVERAAQGVIDIANANIDRALRRVSVARGHDPRGFTLMAFGGAGPLHACEVAERLSIPRVLIPRYPGVLCALGLLVADVRLDYSAAILQRVDDALAGRLGTALHDLTRRAEADLKREGIPDFARTLTASLEMRYQGQAYELSVPLSDTLPASDTHALIDRFHEAHEHAYGHALHGRAVEVVTLRLVAVGLTEKPTFEAAPVAQLRPAIPLQQRADGTALYDRAALQPGDILNGPALIFQLDSTTWLPAGWSARVDGYGNLVGEKMT
ncbi:MAG TPA: hydantoinase/oxoprolinase family protein [Aggregatilineales bacterium]|nr:hydantoinase/oxoprolinase family protein [Aggregatilineales bacterium]